MPALSNRVLEWGILLFAAGCLILAFAVAGCAANPHAVPVQSDPPRSRERITLTWLAQDTDEFCVQSDAGGPLACISVKELRLFVRTYQLAP